MKCPPRQQNINLTVKKEQQCLFRNMEQAPEIIQFWSQALYGI